MIISVLFDEDITMLPNGKKAKDCFFDAFKLSSFNTSVSIMISYLYVLEWYTGYTFEGVSRLYA